MSQGLMEGPAGHEVMVVKKAGENPELTPHVGQILCQVRARQPQYSCCQMTDLFHLGVIPQDVTENLPRPCSSQAATLCTASIRKRARLRGLDQL